MLILFETCLMTALTYGLEACTFSRKKEVRELERIKNIDKRLKRIFQLSIATSCTGSLMKTSAYPLEQ